MRSTVIRTTLILAALASVGCSDDSNPTDPAVTEITWAEKADDLRDKIGQTFQFKCPPNGTQYPVWGDDIYTDDSSICTAAVHDGKITLAAGGNVTIEMRAGQDSYFGSTRNGVTSVPYGSWPSSFFFK